MKEHLDCRLDLDEYQGFTWVWGSTAAMLQRGMPDLRTLFEVEALWRSHHGLCPLDFPTLAGVLSL